MSRPNILLIMSDEHDPAVSGCYGHPLVQTPNLDRLASQGVLFENAYCNNPICVPSRMSFLTGQYASDVNVFDNGSPLASEIPTFAHYLGSVRVRDNAVRAHAHGRPRPPARLRAAALRRHERLGPIRPGARTNSRGAAQ